MYYCKECGQITYYLEKLTDYRLEYRHGRDKEVPFTYEGCPECGEPLGKDLVEITDMQADLMDYKVGDEVRITYEDDYYIGHIESIDLDELELTEHEESFDTDKIEEIKTVKRGYI